MKNIFYQLEFDKYLDALGAFHYKEKNEVIAGVSLLLRFDPVFFGLNEDNFDRNICVNGELQNLCNSVTVGYNNKTKEFSFAEQNFIKGHYSIVGYCKDVVPVDKPQIAKDLDQMLGYKAAFSQAEIIDSEEFYFILEHYGHLFENDQQLQNLVYRYHKVNFFENYPELEIGKSYFGSYNEKVQVANYQNDGKDGLCWEIHHETGIGWVEVGDFEPVSEKNISKEKTFVWWDKL